MSAYPSIRVRMQIEGGGIEDSYTKWGFIYVDSDHRTAAPEKERETTSYAEEEGEHTDLRTVDAPFDYTVNFIIETPNTNKENANVKIKAFNDAIRNVSNGIKRCKSITFYNDYKRVKIVGIPEIIDEPKEFYRQKNGNVLDCVMIELKIHVTKPSLCDFSTTTS